jgi:uncharacterized protein (DUF1499 family)
VRYYQHRSNKATWSQRIALTFLMLFVVTFALHRFGVVVAPFVAKFLKGHESAASFLIVSTPVAIKLLAVAVTGAAIAFLLGVAAMVNIWREGYLGARRATVGVVVSALMLAAPAAVLPKVLRLPRIHEVSTDTQTPPAFSKLALARQGDANPATFQHATAAEQASAYPDIQPLSLNHSVEQAFDTVREAVHGFEWNVIREQPPEDGRAGIIEAVDRSPIFGFTDDIVIRVGGTTRESRIDMRSSARYGDHDLGRNAERVRLLFGEVKTRVAQIDKTERIEKVMKRREEQAQKASGQCTKRKRRAGLCGEDQSASNADRTNSIDPQETAETTGTETPAQDAEPAPSPQEAPGEPAPTRKRRHIERSPSLHRSWEEFLR